VPVESPATRLSGRLRQERVAVLVDVLDAHRRDHLTELSEDDFLRLLLDIDPLQPEQSDRRVVHHFRRRPDRDGEDARHIDADVLGRQRAAQRNLNLNRFETEVIEVLNQRPDERAAAVIALHGVPFSRHAVDHEDAIARAPFEAVGQQHDEAEDHEADEDPDHGEPEARTFEQVVDCGEEKRRHG